MNFLTPIVGVLSVLSFMGALSSQAASPNSFSCTDESISIKSSSVLATKVARVLSRTPGQAKGPVSHLEVVQYCRKDAGLPGQDALTVRFQVRSSLYCFLQLERTQGTGVRRWRKIELNCTPNPHLWDARSFFFPPHFEGDGLFEEGSESPTRSNRISPWETEQDRTVPTEYDDFGTPNDPDFRSITL